MKQIDIKNLEINKHIDYGSFSNVYSVTMDGKNYCYKKFKNCKIFGSEFFDKISSLSELQLLYSVLPKYFVKDNDEFGYLTDLYNHKDLGFAYSYSLKNKILSLKVAKMALVEIQQVGLIHGDIHFGNFLLRPSKLIDFDNCHYKAFNCNYSLLSSDAERFVNKFGMSKDLDIYLFNRMTFSLLNDKTNDIDTDLSIKNYGLFTSKDSIKICKSLLLEDATFNNCFLIDTIDLNDFQKRKLI